MIIINAGNNLTVFQQRQIVAFLSSLVPLYPGFHEWLAKKVMGAADSIILMAHDGIQLTGIAIGRSGPDPKLRCVRVGNHAQGTGLGIRLMDGMINLLECEKPHVTVAEEMMHEYSRSFVKRYGFELSDVTKGEYRPKKLEYHWN